MLKFNVIEPPEIISGFVRNFWILEGSVSKEQPFVHRALADSCPEFLFYYKGSFRRTVDEKETENCFKSGIYGQKQSYDQFSVDEDFGIFGVNIYPFTISQLFSIPTSELSNNCPELKTVCGSAGEILEEKVIFASDHKERIKLVSEFLIKRLDHASTGHSNILNAIREVINQNSSFSVEALSSECNLSRRHFERKFREFSGFSPGMFLSITRFGHAIKNNSNTTKSLTQIAYECGYYDQSHFIRDFRKFSGYSPKEYFTNAKNTDYRATIDFRM